MARIISIHSFRGGTGKSKTTANLAAVLAADGLRVGAIDTDIQSPGIHILFGLAGEQISASLNDYLWHGRDIKDTAQDVTLAGRCAVSCGLAMCSSLHRSAGWPSSPTTPASLGRYQTAVQYLASTAEWGRYSIPITRRWSER